MSVDTRPARPRRAKLPPEQPSIPQRKGGTGAYWLYLLPGFVLLLVIVIIPLVWNVYLTFTKWKGVRSPEFIGLDTGRSCSPTQTSGRRSATRCG